MKLNSSRSITKYCLKAYFHLIRDLTWHDLENRPNISCLSRRWASLSLLFLSFSSLQFFIWNEKGGEQKPKAGDIHLLIVSVICGQPCDGRHQDAYRKEAHNLLVFENCNKQNNKPHIIYMSLLFPFQNIKK